MLELVVVVVVTGAAAGGGRPDELKISQKEPSA